MKNINKLLTNNIIFILIIFLSIFTLYQNVKPYYEVNQENAKLKEELASAKNQKKELSNEYNLITDESTQKQVVRERYHISNEDEIIFIFPEEGTNEE